MVDTVIVENETAPTSAISWPAILGGAFVSFAVTIILLAIGSGLGLSAAPWAAERAITTTKAATVAGVYMTAIAILASAVGGFIAGRFRTLWTGIHRDEALFRDTGHGVIAWAVATVALVLIVGSSAVDIGRSAVRGLATDTRDPSAGYLDRLFDYDYEALQRNQGKEAIPGISRDWNGDRSAAGRILASESAANYVATPAEHARLVAIVAARTGLSVPESEKRVSAVEADARAAAETARRVGVTMSFWFAASLLAGALASALAAWEGGEFRDGRFRS